MADLEHSSPVVSKESVRDARILVGKVLKFAKPYWHAMPTSLASGFRWNTRLYQGFMQCAALDKLRYPEGVIIDYNMMMANETIAGWGDRERLWEEIRQGEFPDRPSRIGAWYLFDDPKYMEIARNKYGWFNDREIFEVRIFPGANVFRADMDLVGGSDNEWPERARRYWSGELSADALVEVVVSGTIYVPDWDTEEFRTALQRPFQG
jgi:hypothetical protein